VTKNDRLGVRGVESQGNLLEKEWTFVRPGARSILFGTLASFGLGFYGGPGPWRAFGVVGGEVQYVFVGAFGGGLADHRGHSRSSPKSMPAVVSPGSLWLMPSSKVIRGLGVAGSRFPGLARSSRGNGVSRVYAEGCFVFARGHGPVTRKVGQKSRGALCRSGSGWSAW